jgi:hypothetical protein
MNPDRAIIGSDGLSWEQWLVALNEEIKRQGLQHCYGKIDASAGIWNGWASYFMDGMSPREAIAEDLTNL